MTDYSRDVRAQRLLQLSEEVSRIASTLAGLSLRLEAPFNEDDPAPDANGPDVSESAVRWLIRARQQRKLYLPNELFADPAWDMLLDLLHAEITKRKVSVSSLCIASAVAASTAVRWINSMVDQGVLIRQPDPSDGRRIFIELAPEVSAGLRRYFVDVVQRQKEFGKAVNDPKPDPANQNDV